MRHASRESLRRAIAQEEAFQAHAEQVALKLHDAGRAHMLKQLEPRRRMLSAWKEKLAALEAEIPTHLTQSRREAAAQKRERRAERRRTER